MSESWMFRPNDHALMEFASVVIDGVTIPRIFATPERAFARMQEEIQKRNVDDIPLPFISVFRVGYTFDQSRWSDANFRNHWISTDGHLGYQARYFRSYMIQYQIDVWCKYRSHLNDLMEQFLLKFDPAMAWIPIDYGVEGTVITGVTLESVSSNSDLEPGENQDRVLRESITLSTEGRLYQREPYTRVPTVRKVEIDYYDGRSPEDYLVFWETQVVE